MDYLSKVWNQQIIERFYAELRSTLDLIQHNPTLFKFADQANGIRSCLPNKHDRLYYKVVGNELIILRIYPNRRNPDMLSFKT